MDLKKKPSNSRTVPWIVNQIAPELEIDPQIVTAVVRYIYEQTRLALGDGSTTTIELSGIGTFKTTMSKAIKEFLRYRYVENGSNSIPASYLENIRGKINKMLDNKVQYSARTEKLLIKGGFLDNEGTRINPATGQGPEEPLESTGGIQE